MKKQTVLLLTIIITTLFGCNYDVDKIDKKFSKVKDLSEYQKTEFIPTLEHKITDSINSIYCATLLFAWNEIREEINSPLEISSEYIDLNLLNNSKTFIDVLKTNEYDAIGGVSGNSITARAEFSKSLPFETKLQNFKNKLVFDGQNVASFGVYGDDINERLNIVQIIYYKNDLNFIIKLFPKDEQHEIFLFKTEQNFSTITEMSAEIEKLTEIGLTEKKNEKNRWKYYFNDEDEVVIPKFNFNIESNYSTLEGNKFKIKNQSWQIVKAWQRTAFILDESGAEIESEAEIELNSVQENYEKPKKMILDKPFLTLLKRTDAKNPYFGLWTTNAELMIRE